MPCQLDSHGRCAICHRIDPASPGYSSDYRRLFHPEEFPAGPEPEPPRPAEPPGLVRKAVNLGRAVAEHVAAGLPRADDDTARRRLEVCSGCVQYDGSSCRICGCNMAAKVRMLEQRCPLGLW